MSRFPRPSSAIALLLLLGAFSSVAATAEELALHGSPPLAQLPLLAMNDAPGTEASPASEPSGEKEKKGGQEATQTDSAFGNYQMSTSADTPLSDADTSTIGFSQQTSASGYEQAASGIAIRRSGRVGEMLMTAPTKGRGLRLSEGLSVYPAVMLGLGFNDNVTAVQTGRKSSSLFIVAPEAVAEIRRQGGRYTLSYQGNYGRYQDSSADNYDNHELWLGADSNFTPRFHAGVGFGYIEQVDPRGSTDFNSSGLTEPSRWHAPIVRAIATYGNRGAIGRFELEGSLMNKRYENNRAVTEGSDADFTTLSGRFFYRIMPRTSALFELRETITDYKLATSSLDNHDRRVYVGATWKATAKTEGTIKLGRAYKNFNDASRPDTSGGSWEAGISWSPLTYSVFQLNTSKSMYDSFGVGNFVIGTSRSLTWTHRWASYISSRATIGKTDADYDGVSRKDDTTNYGIAFYREMGHNLRLGVDYRNTNRDSNQAGFSFKRNVTMITLEGVL